MSRLCVKKKIGFLYLRARCPVSGCSLSLPCPVVTPNSALVISAPLSLPGPHFMAPACGNANED